MTRTCPIFLTQHGRNSPIIQAVVHQTPADRERGLQNVRYLPMDHGALFIFPSASMYTMTMRNTHLPLDILFADEHGKVHTAHKSVPAMSRRLLRGGWPSKYVLELRGGYCDTYRIRCGASIQRFDGKDGAR